MSYPDRQHADFFRALRPFQHGGPDDDWLIALTCSAGRAALADMKIATGCLSVVTSLDRCALAIACGCYPGSLIYAAAASGSTAVLARLCDDFPEAIPIDIITQMIECGTPTSIAASIQCLHEFGYPIGPLRLDRKWMAPGLLNYLLATDLADVTDWEAGQILKYNPTAYIMAAYAPGTPLTVKYPAGPKEWAKEVFHSTQNRDDLAIIQHCYALGWDMKNVPYYVVKYDHSDILAWLGSEGILDRLDLDDVSRLCDVAHDRRSPNAIAWLGDYYTPRAEAAEEAAEGAQ